MSELTERLTTGRSQATTGRPRVVIIGGGFGGLNAARSLAHVPVDVTVVDRRNHHLFQPLLYQVALAVLSPADIAQPIRTILRHQSNAEVLMDEVVAIDVSARQVALASGSRLNYDYLAVATGATHSYFGNDQWEPLAPGLKNIEDAIEIRRRVLLAFELAERQMVETGSHPTLNFVVVGGGPTGVELAGAISDIAQLYMRHDFRHIDPSKSRVLLLDGGSRILAAYPPDLSAKAEAELKRLRVEVHTKMQVTGVGPGWVEANGQRIEAVVTLWAAGVQASPLGRLLGAPLDKRGCVMVDDRLNPPGLPEVFVIGDLAHFEQDGHQVPGVAQPAMQMGDHIGKIIAADLAGRSRPAFRYFDKGDMATIGRMSAVAKVEWPFKAHMSGFPAWFTWVTIHIFFLIGFRNRISVLLSWAWTYFTFSRGARLITGDQTLPGWKEQPAKSPPGAKAAD
ncbi:NADH dehydrogenase [Candidatus Sulfotelmatomonas gaucii]|uniref:NADH:ubiquinone reductase (non-electrogenic) n=1 Tax=Candidatus Sulfuritelmatomonas gaucii TaxID=2043161 RepID=A0A2N9M5F5_9BACT|nr:NADH dehydrogenase [Candidatus Sulfotelmatomonas gaucii]